MATSAIDRRSKHYRVGLLMVICGGLFVAMILFTLGAGLNRDSDQYHILFEENVKGMVVGSKVNFQGVPAGAVADIRFQDGKSLVEIEVHRDYCEVQEVTRARLDRLLVTGQVTIELEGYQKGLPRLASGAFVSAKQNPISELTRTLPDMLENVPSLLGRLELLLANLNVLVGGENRDRVAGLLADLERTAAGLPAAVEAVHGAAASIPALVAAVAATTERAGDLLAGDTARSAVVEVARTASRLEAVAADVGALVGEARSLIGGSRGTWHEALRGVRDAMRDVRGLARLLQLAPSSLLYGREVRELPATPAGGGR